MTLYWHASNDGLAIKSDFPTLMHSFHLAHFRLSTRLPAPSRIPRALQVNCQFPRRPQLSWSRRDLPPLPSSSPQHAHHHGTLRRRHSHCGSQTGAPTCEPHRASSPPRPDPRSPLDKEEHTRRSASRDSNPTRYGAAIRGGGGKGKRYG